VTTHRKRAVIVGVLSIIATAFLFIGEAVYKPILSLAQPQEVAELETFIDGLMTAQLEEYQIPGSVVVIVQDGEVSLAKGYGYANIERRLKVNPETSMFRIASKQTIGTGNLSGRDDVGHDPEYEQQTSANRPRY